MKSISVSFGMLVILASFAFSNQSSAFGRKASSSPGSTPADSGSSLVPADVIYDGQVQVKLDSLQGFGSSGESKLQQAAKILETVLNSEEFRQAVLNYTYQGQVKFADDSGLSNEQILHKLLAAKEIYNTTEDHVADFSLSLYTPPFYKKWSVVGYTTPGQPRIYMNSYYFNSFTPNDIAGNMAHEWTHKLGFDHDFNRTARRPYSVPYAVGEMVIEISKHLGF